MFASSSEQCPEEDVVRCFLFIFALINLYRDFIEDAYDEMMPKKDFIKKIFEMLFPTKNGFNFSGAGEEELFKILPGCGDLRGATALAGRRVFVALSYKNRTVRSLVWRIKYKRDPHAVRHGGYILHRIILEKMREGAIAMPLTIIPMPVSPARRRERGYNQCELLAQAAAAWADRNEKIFELRTDILGRRKNARKQTFKNRRERMESMRGVFEVRKEKNAAGGGQKTVRSVILLDDVITTGSTLREAMDCLERAGFADVTGIGLAH